MGNLQIVSSHGNFILNAEAKDEVFIWNGTAAVRFIDIPSDDKK